MPFKDPVEKKAYCRQWHLAHREQCRLVRRRWGLSNRKRLLLQQRKYSSAHREQRVEISRTYQRSHPWANHLSGIRARCTNPHRRSFKHYGARGIKNFLTHQDIKALWDRDRAAQMQRPSIDRIDNDGHYTLANCRFIELSENIAKSNRERCYAD